MQTMFESYSDDKFHVLTLIIDGSTSAWAQQHGLTHPVLNDNNQNVWDIYGEGYIPLNIVLDTNFIIRYKQAGFSESAIVSIIAQYLPAP